jgi:hypothetical protein
MPERNQAAHAIRGATERLRELASAAPAISAELIRIARELDVAANALEMAYAREPRTQHRSKAHYDRRTDDSS